MPAVSCPRPGEDGGPAMRSQLAMSLCLVLLYLKLEIADGKSSYMQPSMQRMSDSIVSVLLGGWESVLGETEMTLCGGSMGL